MADVQTEHGWLKLANALHEALMRKKGRLPTLHRAVFDAVVRLTYGWDKKADRISASRIQTFTEIPRHHVVELLGDLERWKLITIERRGAGRTSVLAVQKNFDLWEIGETANAVRIRARKPVRSNGQVQPSAPTCPVQRTPPVLSNGQVPVRSNGHTTANSQTLSTATRTRGSGTGRSRGPDVTRERIEDVGLCEELREAAIGAGWGVLYGRCVWAGEAGRIAWFVLREYVLRKPGQMRDRVRTFAQCARKGLKHGSATIDEPRALAVIAQLDAHGDEAGYPSEALALLDSVEEGLS